MEEYISHVDYKKMMENFKRGTPKKILKEGLEKEGNAFTVGLAKAKKGEKFKVGDKAVKDTSNYDASMEEASYTDNYEGSWGYREGMKESGTGDAPFDFNKSAIESATGDKISHVETDDYGMPVYWGTKNPNVTYQISDNDQIIKYDSETGERFPIGDLKSYDEPTHDYEPDTDADYEEPRDDFDMAGGDFNDGEFWENEVKKLQEIAGVGPQDDGPDDDNDEARKKRADKEEEEDTEAENAERDLDEEESKVNMHDPGTVAKIVAQKHGKELKDLVAIYDTRSDADHKVRNKAWKDFENAAINWAGHEMLEAGENKVAVGNLLSAYGYFEDWAPDYLDSLKQELRGMEEGVNEIGGHGDAPDNPKLQAAAKYLVQNRDRFLTQDYFFPHAISTLSLKSDKDLYDYIVNNWHSDGVYDTVAHMKSQIEKDMYANTDPNIADPIDDMEEGLHMPPLQATGQTIVTNEDQAPYGFSVLSPDERNQLKEYITHYKTIKSEISKLLEKAGKSGKIMEGIKEDEAVPAARPAHYNEPTKTPKHNPSNLGGNRTGLVMTKAEMWENEEGEDSAHDKIESQLSHKLHDAFHKVTGMIMKDLIADGFDEGDIKAFLQHEIEEKAKEATMSQYDM
jgi:hypothetical protein